MKAGRPVVIAAALAAAAGMAQAQEYDIHIVEALSTFGIPESYLWDVNELGVAIGLMTYTVEVSPGRFSTVYKSFRWTEAGGPEVFVDGPRVNAINNRGDMAAGGTIHWAAGGLSVVEPLPGYPTVRAGDLNDNGMFVGASHWKSTSCCSYNKAIYWTESGGTFDISAVIPTANFAYDVNNEGQIVGVATINGSSGYNEAFLYDSTTGVHTNLHELLTGGGPGITGAAAINNHGAVVGNGFNGSFVSAWVWEPAAGFTFLPALKGGDRDRNTPADINDDGQVVGSAATDGYSDSTAYIWDKARGIRDLSDLVDLPADFILTGAHQISNAGVIVGGGHWGPAWGPPVAVVLIPRDSGCRPDLDGDDALTFFDFLAFQNLFEVGDLRADFDGSGALDFFDFLAFQNEFVAGCP